MIAVEKTKHKNTLRKIKRHFNDKLAGKKVGEESVSSI